jgi:hypothetical protein
VPLTDRSHEIRIALFTRPSYVPERYSIDLLLVRGRPLIPSPKHTEVNLRRPQRSLFPRTIMSHHECGNAFDCLGI